MWSAACHTSGRVNGAGLFRERCEIPQRGGREKEEQLTLMDQNRPMGRARPRLIRYNKAAMLFIQTVKAHSSRAKKAS